MMNPEAGPVKHRSKLRRRLGKEFYILLRKTRDASSGLKWAHQEEFEVAPLASVIRHRSQLLRKLRSVDMELQYNKLVNLDIALKGTTRVVIRPGETYSFWHLVGRPTRRKGYLDGLILENGKIGRGVGGGLCQLGNLIYWMLLHTSLTVTERWRHGYDVFPDANRKVPFGSGATLSYNYIDLQFRNDTSQTYYLHIWKDAENLCGEILCSEAEPYLAEVFETDHMFVQQSWGGYLRCNKIWVRRKYSDGHEETKLISENQALMMYEPLLVAHT